MPYDNLEDLGKLFLRLPVGLLLLLHAYGFLRGDPGIPNAVAAWGLPGFVAWLAFLLEVAGSLMVILGVFTRAGGLAIAIFMLAAIVMYHIMTVEGLPGSGNHLFQMGMNPAGTHFDKYYLETQTFFLFNALAVALLGQGRYGLGIGGRWN